MRWLLVLMPILMWSTTVHAFGPSHAKHPHSQPIRNLERGRVPISVLPTGSQVYWDVNTSSIAVIAPNVWRVTGDPVRSADGVIATLRPWLRVGPDGLRFASSGQAKGKHYVHFKRYADGLRVVGGRLDVQISQGRVVLIRADLHPDIQLDTDPKLTVAHARTAAEDSLSIGGWLAREHQSSELVILPTRTDKSVEYRLAWEINTTTQWPRGDLLSYVDARTGEILHRVDRVAYVTDTNLTVEAQHETRMVGDPLVTSPVPFLGATDATGVATYAVDVTQNVSLGFAGPYTTLENLETTNASGLVTLAEGVDQTFTWDASNSTLAERNAFVAFQKAHARMKVFAPDLTWLDTNVPIYVGTDSECNAYWDGVGAVFFRESDTCNDTGRIADVVYHEVGHGLHQSVTVGGIWDPALGEGQADYLSATITGDPNIAPTFFKTGEGIRNIEPDMIYPDDLTGEVHVDGLIWGGAMWDLRKGMMGLYGATNGIERTDVLHIDSLRGGPTIPDGYWEVLAADDDDANLTNGTPNVCAINDAFGIHGLGPGPGAGIAFDFQPVGRQAADAPVTITTDLFPQYPECGPFDSSLGQLHWREAGKSVFNSMPLVSTAGTTFQAEIPGVEPGTKIEYYLEHGLGDEARREPREAPDRLFEYYVGDLLTIFFDDFENGEGGWAHAFSRAPGDPDAQAAADDWELGTPQGASGDPDRAFSGDNVWGNDLGNGTNGAYRPNVTNHLRSPRIDCRGFRGTRLQFRKWLNVEDGTYDQAKIRINGQPVWVNEPGGGTRHHRDGHWHFFDIDIAQFADKNYVTVEFELFSDSGLQMGGWNIDDVALVATGTGPIPKDCACDLRPSSGSTPSAWLLLFALGGLFVLRRRGLS